MYTADRRAGAMHGKQFLLDAVHAGIDDTFLYGRLDFAENTVPTTDFELVVNVESWAIEEPRPRRTLRLDVKVESGRVRTWKLGVPDENPPMALIGDDGNGDDGNATMERSTEQVAVAVARNFEFKLPLAWLLATPVASTSVAPSNESNAVVTRLRLRFSLWQNGLPTDALPEDGWMELPLLRQEDLIAHW